MRRLLTILLVTISLVSFGQSNLSNAKVKRVAHVDSVFHENLPIGSLIINSDNAVADGGVYRVKASNGVASTRTITTSLANDEINEISGLTGEQLTKLNGIEAGAEVNVQADLTETNTAFDSYVIGSDSIVYPHDSTIWIVTKYDILSYYTKTQSDSKFLIDSMWTEGLTTYFRQGGVLDSIRETQTSDDLWYNQNDTLYSNKYPVRIDTMIAGEDNSYDAINVVFNSFTKTYDGTSVESITAYSYAFSASGKYQYKTILDGSDYKIVRSQNFGVTFADTLTTVQGYAASRHKLDCSLDGSVLVYTDYLSNNRLIVSRDYGESFDIETTTETASSIGDIAISDDGVMIAISISSRIYRYRNSISTSFTNSGGVVDGLAIKNDSTIFYIGFETSDYNLFKLSPSNSKSTIRSVLNYAADLDYSNNTIYVGNENVLEKSDDDGDTWTTVYTFTDTNTRIPFLKVSSNEKYIYLNKYSFTDFTWDLFVSDNFGASFDSISTSTANEIQINKGVSASSFEWYFEEGRMKIAKGGIRLPDTYTPIYAKDIVTKDALEAATGGFQAITSVNTNIGSGLEGGGSTGALALKLDISNISTSVISPASTDRVPIMDDTDDVTKYITLSTLDSYFGGGGSGVTSFSAGNLSPLFTTSVANATSTPALTFSLTATTTYRVFGTAGTTTPSYIALTDNHIPDNITASNYLPLSGAGTLTGGKLITAATTSSYASVNLPHGTAPSTPSNGDLWTTTSGVFARVNGVTIDLSSSGGGGVNSVTFPSTGGLYNSGTSTDINGILDFSNLNDVSIALGDYIAFTDISSGTSPLAVRRETVSDLKVLVSPTVKEADGSPSYTNIETIEFDGAVVSQPSAGVARVTISESGGGGGDESFQTLTSSSSISWNFTTSKNANLTIGTNATLTISNQANGEDGELWVYPNASNTYTLTFPSYYFANDHSNVFTIEAGSGLIYRFTLKYNGTHRVVDYATYFN